MWLEVSSATLLALAQDVPLPLVEALQPSSQTYPALSPDGTRLLFSSGARGALNLYILELDTGSTVTLTDGPTEDSAAVWSPDGLQIVFQREEANGNRDLWIISADGAAEKNIVTAAANEDVVVAISCHFIFKGAANDPLDIENVGKCM